MSFRKCLSQFLNSTKEKIAILYQVSKNPETPLLAKIVIIIALAYAASPIDLIPDFIPVLGYLDDLVILSFLVLVAYKLIPKSIWNDAYQRTKINTEPLPKNWFMASIIILFWVVLTTYLIYTLTQSS